MKKLLIFFITLSFSYTSFGQETFTLRSGESISSLLYDRLQIRPSSMGDINKVIEFNNISAEEVRSLKAGALIKIPPEVMSKSPLAQVRPSSQETTQDLKQKPLKPFEGKIPNKGFGLIFERMRSVGDSLENVYLTALRPSFFFLPSWESGQNQLQARIEASLLLLQNDSDRKGDDSFLLGEVYLEYLRRIEAFDVGVKIRNNRQVLILPFTNSYEVFASWLWGWGPVAKWHRYGFAFLFIPDQGSGERRTRKNFETSLSYDFIYQNYDLTVRGFYGNTSIEAVDTRELGFMLEYYF